MTKNAILNTHFTVLLQSSDKYVRRRLLLNEVLYQVLLHVVFVCKIPQSL